MRLIFILASTLALSACESSWERLPNVQREVDVVDVDPPKRLYVTLRDTQNGKLYRDIYVAKRCWSYEQVPVGSRFTMNFNVYRNKETHKLTVEPDSHELYELFCG